MPWYMYALASALLFAAQELIMRILAIKSVVPRVFSVVFNAWGAFFAIVVFFLQRGSFTQLWQLTPFHYILIVSAMLAYGLYERFQFTARKGLDASVIAIIFRLETAFLFIGAIVFLHEALTVAKIIGTALIISASLLLVYKNPHFKITRAFWYALLCAVCMGIAITVDKPASAGLQPALYSFVMWVFPITIIAFPHIRKQQFFKELRIGTWKVALAALFNVVGYILFIQSLALADASRVVPVVATNSILVVVGGIVILHEHDHLWRKCIAITIAFAGVFFLR